MTPSSCRSTALGGLLVRAAYSGDGRLLKAGDP